jgi:8-oxo-dGTP diphosphatase
MNASRIVDVAVGVLIRDDGEFLLAQRPAGKPYAGYWEFPGGKLEPGESVAQALHRELHEELGLDIGTVCPWVVREHVYPHAHVRLHFCRVFDWGGDAHGREGQAFGFFSLHRLPAGPLLEGALPVMPWLALPERCRLLLEGAASDPAAAPAAGPAAAPAVTATKPEVLSLRRAARLGASAAWWVESGAVTPRRGCEVRNRAEAEAAVSAGADFLVVADRGAGAVLELTAIPVFVIAGLETTLSSLRARGAHGRADVVPF